MVRNVRFALVAPMLLAATACTLSRPLAYHAVSYNRAVESAQNRMLLLNVVRASQRMPMYFTGIGSITAGLSYTVNSGSLSLTNLASVVGSNTANNNGDVTNARTTTGADTESLKLPSVSYSHKPTVQVAVLDTHEFMRGTLSAVEPKVFQYYWQQGWKLDVLLYLLVERIELPAATEDLKSLQAAGTVCRGLETGDSSRRTVRNDPEDLGHFSEFRNCVAVLMELRCRFELASKKTPVGLPIFPASISEYVEAHEAGLVVESAAANTVQLVKPEVELRLACPDTSSKDQNGMVGRFNQRIETDLGGGDESPGKGIKSTGKSEFSLFLRSPQGVLYYLGEILRVWNGKPKASEAEKRIPWIRLGNGEGSGFQCPGRPAGTCQPLFLAREPTSGCSQAAVAVEYAGSTYMIPAEPERQDHSAGSGGPVAITPELCHPGRSMQALTLVSQLISLQKSSKDLPGTALVRVVGD